MFRGNRSNLRENNKNKNDDCVFRMSIKFYNSYDLVNWKIIFNAAILVTSGNVHIQRNYTKC